MREIKGFKEDTGRTVICLDEPNPNAGGACHHYSVETTNEGQITEVRARIKFQDGLEEAVGMTGIQDIDLLHIYRDRLMHFQAGSDACEEYDEMLAHLEKILELNKKLTQKRTKRGVEGTNEV